MAGNASTVIGRAVVMVVPKVQQGSGALIASQLGAELNGAPIGQQVGQQIGQGAQQTTQGTGSSIGAGLGRAIVGGIAALGIGTLIMGSISAELGKEENSAMMASKLGLSKQDAERYTEASNEVFKKGFGESREEVNAAMTSIVSSIKGARDLSDEQLGEMTGSMVNLSKTFGFEAPEINKSIQSMMSAGIVGSFEDGMNVITTGLQTGGDKADDLLDTFREYSGDFASLGMNGKDALGAINGLLDAGVMNTDKAADGFRELFTRVRNGDKVAIESLEALGLNAKEVQAQFIAGGSAAKEGYGSVIGAINEASGLVKSTAVTNLFGSPGEDFYAAFNQGVSPDAINSIGDISGAVTTMNENYANTGQSLAGFKRSLQDDVSVFIAAEVLPALISFTNWFKTDIIPALTPVWEAFKGFGSAIGALLPVVSGLIGFISQFSNVIIPVAIVLLSVAGTIKTIVAIQTLWAAITASVTAAQIALNIAMTANPIGLVIGLVVGLTAAFIYLWKNSEGFRDFFKTLGSNIVSAFRTAVDFVKKAINELFKFLNNTFGDFTFPDWVPFAGGKKLVNIPTYADGGVVKASPGGSVIRVAERGQPERIINEFEYQNMRRQINGANSADINNRSGGMVQNINVSGKGMDEQELAVHMLRLSTWR